MNIIQRPTATRRQLDTTCDGADHTHDDGATTCLVAAILVHSTHSQCSVRTSPNSVLRYAMSPELRTRTVLSSGRTEPELNRTVGSVLAVLVLCISSGLNFGNPNVEVESDVGRAGNGSLSMHL
jgi:hypothetical protein